MFCTNCGRELPPAALTCPACGATAAKVDQGRPQLQEKVAVASKDALRALQMVALNPVGGLAKAFQALDPPRAIGVGAAFAVAFAVAMVIGVLLGLPRWGGGLRLADILKALLFSLVPPLSVFAASALLRKILRARGGMEVDAFLAGIAVAPLGMVALLFGILGFGNLEVVAAAAVFAVSYTILILFTGCTSLSGISEGTAALVVPVIILASMWISKVIYAALFHNL